MTVSMRVMSAGDGYKYLLKTVAVADGDRPLSTPLTRLLHRGRHPTPHRAVRSQRYSPTTLSTGACCSLETCSAIRSRARGPQP